MSCLERSFGFWSVSTEISRSDQCQKRRSTLAERREGLLKSEIAEIEKLADDFISNHDEEGEVELNNRWIEAVGIRASIINTHVLILSDVISEEMAMPEHQSFNCLIRTVSGSTHSVSDPTPLPRRVLELWGVLPKWNRVR